MLHQTATQIHSTVCHNSGTHQTSVQECEYFFLFIPSHINYCLCAAVTLFCDDIRVYFQVCPILYYIVYCTYSCNIYADSKHSSPILLNLRLRSYFHSGQKLIPCISILVIIHSAAGFSQMAGNLLFVWRSEKMQSSPEKQCNRS